VGWPKGGLDQSTGLCNSRLSNWARENVMKKTYEKPLLLKRDVLSGVTAVPNVSERIT